MLRIYKSGELTTFIYTVSPYQLNTVYLYFIALEI